MWTSVHCTPVSMVSGANEAGSVPPTHGVSSPFIGGPIATVQTIEIPLLSSGGSAYAAAKQLAADGPQHIRSEMQISWRLSQVPAGSTGFSSSHGGPPMMQCSVL